MKYELIKVTNEKEESISDCFPDFFDDCNPNDEGCMPNGTDE